MNADQRLAGFRRLSDKGLLTARQIDIAGVHTLAHRRHGTRSVLSTECQDHEIRLVHRLQCLRKTGFVRPGNRIAIGIADFRLRQSGAHFFQQASARWFLAAQDCVKHFCLIRLNVRSRNSPDRRSVSLYHAAHPRYGVCDRISRLHHAQMRITAKKLSGTVRVRADQRDLFSAVCLF